MPEYTSDGYKERHIELAKAKGREYSHKYYQANRERIIYLQRKRRIAAKLKEEQEKLKLIKLVLDTYYKQIII